MDGFKGNQLVFHNEGGIVKAGGYIINSKILQSGGSAIKNLNVSNGNGLQKMAIPAGLFLIHENKNPNLEINDINEIQTGMKGGGVISDSIFDKLINKLGGKKRKGKKTRSKKKKSGKKTRKKKK